MLVSKAFHNIEQSTLHYDMLLDSILIQFYFFFTDFISFVFILSFCYNLSLAQIATCYDRYLLDTTWTWVKGMTMMIGYTGVVSVSASCGRHCNLTQSSLSPSCSLMYDASWILCGHSLNCIYSVDTFLYPYTLPLLYIP